MLSQKGKSKLLLLSLALVLLGGCGRASSKNSNIPKATYGQMTCDYVASSNQKNLGNFDLQIVQTNDPKLYALWVTPIALAQVGDLINITVSGASSQYRELIQQIRLQVGRPIKVGILSVDELELYTNIIIAQYQPGVNPLESKAKLVNICTLPLPGDNVTQGERTL